MTKRIVRWIVCAALAAALLAAALILWAMRAYAGCSMNSLCASILRMLPAFIAIGLAVAALSFFVARLAAKRIVAPIIAIDPDAPLSCDVYDELSPLLCRMERQRAEIASHIRALTEQQSELSAITEHMREGLILLDCSNTVLSINGSAARIFGVDAQTHIGGDMLALARDVPILHAVEQARKGQSADTLFERESCFYQLLANPVEQGGRTVGVILLLLDITEKHTAELSRREFTANVSHELKTPLTSISGYAEIMRDGLARPADLRRFAARIYDEAKRLLALVNDILELSRLDERRGLGEREPVALMPLARDAVRRLAPLAAEKNISLTAEGEEAVIMGYPSLLDEMAYNLVDNAVKYTEDGGSVRVSVTRAGGKATLMVSDTGVGIPPEHQEHVFERFYRVDRSRSKATGGTGLGLSIVKHGAAAHDAQLALRSEPGRGTRIWLTFTE